jgi:hypothetical protein
MNGACYESYGQFPYENRNRESSFLDYDYPCGWCSIKRFLKKRGNLIPYTPLPRLVRAGALLAGSGLPSYPRKCRGAVGFTGFALLAVLLAASIIASAAGRDNNGEPKRVVILNATDPYLPAFLVLDGAMSDAIKTGRAEPTLLNCTGK